MTDKERIQYLEAKIKQLEAEHEKELLNLRNFKEMVMSLDQGVMVVDNDDKITKVYESFEKLTGYREEELLGKEAAKVLLRKGDLVSELQLREQHRYRDRGEVSAYEIPIIRKDGEEIWVSISGSPLYDEQGKKIGSIGIHHDISRQKRLQKSLQQAREESDRAKHAEERFLAKMSHEIRTPLNAVIGMSYLLKNTKVTGEQKEYIDVIARSGNLLLNLINDILDYSKISSGQVQVRPVDFNLRHTLSDIAQTFRLKTKERNLKVELETDVDHHMLVGDEVLLNQILMNLVGNAEKFTDEGYIKIEANTLAEFEDKVTIQFTVEDTGMGISKDRQEAIFHEFVQAEGVVLEDQKGGTGLGLAIVKKIIEMLGGKIWIESELGIGTKMHFVLNFEISKMQESLQEELERERKTNDENNTIDPNLRLLIAEDNLMNQKYISRVLERKHVNFEIVANGKMAVKASEQERFDVIFMDLFMPVMDGFEATTAIRTADNPNAETPIYALTATAVEQHKKKALITGMNGFISKPFHPEEIYSVLHEISQVKHHKSNNTLHIEEKDMSYTFTEGFDKELLETYYGNDTEYALEMFEIFLDQLRQTVPLIVDAIEQSDRKELRHNVHKIKPTFTMVGLPDVTKYFEGWEKAIDVPQNDFSQFATTWENIKGDIEKYDALVEIEIKRLKDFEG